MADLTIGTAILALGALGLVYRLLAPDNNINQAGNRASDTKLSTATEGTPITRLWGKHRVKTQVIWATRFTETVSTEKTKIGGKGGGATQTTTTYTYTQSFALGLCERGEGTVQIKRMWADGQLLDLSKNPYKLHSGSETTKPNPLIARTEGDAPAFRGLTYLVFEDFDVTPFGNRLPQITVEFERSNNTNLDRLERSVKAVTLGPGTGSFLLSSEESRVEKEKKEDTVLLNRDASSGNTYLKASADILQQELPNVGAIVLDVCWFADDLHAGNAKIEPRATAYDEVKPVDWEVAGLTRDTAKTTTYLGTPSDHAVLEALDYYGDLGWTVILNPKILMDVPPHKPSPYDGSEQLRRSHRRQITCSPAPGHSHTADGTIFGAHQVRAFTGRARGSDWTDHVYQGTVFGGATIQEWSYNRFILHYAHLCRDHLFDGYDSFLLGSEMMGLTRVRGASGKFEFVEKLLPLMADVRTVLPGIKVSYAAHSEEYGKYKANYYPLNKFWAKADFVGINNYLPLTDWRTRDDYDYSLAEMEANITRGEDYDYIYTSEVDRAREKRTPITHGNKDLLHWWQTSRSPWVAKSKPLVFTKLAYRAVDKGANAVKIDLAAPPSSSLFPDPPLLALPHYSSGIRDDLLQRRALEAWLSWAKKQPAGFIQQSDIFVSGWDVRPWPTYPHEAKDETWATGELLVGRLNINYVIDLVLELGAAVGLQRKHFNFDALDSHTLYSLFSSNNESPRDILEAVLRNQHLNVCESEGRLKITPKAFPSSLSLDQDSLVSTKEKPEGFEITTRQETELPSKLEITFASEADDYNPATAFARKQTGNSQVRDTIKTDSVIEPAQARNLAEEILQEHWIGRQTMEATFGRELLQMDLGDHLLASFNGREYDMRLEDLTLGEDVKIKAQRANKTIYDPRRADPNLRTISVKSGGYGGTFLSLVDIPLDPRIWSPKMAVFQSPWPGSVNVYEEDGSGGYALLDQIDKRSVVGTTTTEFEIGQPWKWSYQSLTVEFTNTKQIVSLNKLSVLNGQNTIAVQHMGGWELVQFRKAKLVGANTYELSGLLRGQAGTEYAIGVLPAGASVVFIDGNWVPMTLDQNEIGIEKALRYGPASVIISDNRYTDLTYTPQGRGLMCFSPVHLKVAPTVNALRLSWIRRSRLDADDWDVPLNEDKEVYEVDILKTGKVIRTLRVNNVPAITYTAEDQIKDFEGPQATVDFDVYQISGRLGRGEVAKYRNQTWLHQIS